MKTKIDLAFDTLILLVFLVVSSPALTGNTIHEWLSVAFAATIVVHLLLHWAWLVSVTKTFFKKLFHQSRLNYVVNVLFFVAMVGVIFSGLLISKDVLPLLGLGLNGVGRAWERIHTFTADASLVLLGVHFALHWKWIVANLKRYAAAPLRGAFHHPPTLAVQPVRMDKES